MAELAKANEILSDPERKDVYDRFGSKGVATGEKLEGMHRVNGFTVFLCDNLGVLPKNSF